MSADNEAGAVRRTDPPGGAVKKPARNAPENLGQESAQSPLKRNTSGQGEKQDRGP